MKNGIYQVRLSSEGPCVEGIAVIHDNVINGGAGGYYWRGIILQPDTVLTVKAQLKKWDHQAHHVLGLFKEVSMAMRGRYDAKKRSFDFQGQVNGHHIVRVQATGHWIASLAKAGRNVHSK